jgi:tricorn protease
MKIAEVIEKGPFDHSRTKVKAGCIIEKINGEELAPDKDITALLNNKAGKKTLVSLYNPQNKERWEEVVMPITSGRLNGLLYKRWVKQRAADVEKWSNGRLGYVHIQSMGDGSFRTVYSDILGKYNNCDGIVIDTRFNGGGRLHEDIEILFSGQKYFTQVVRGREACDMPSRRWNKPSIMLQTTAAIETGINHNSVTVVIFTQNIRVNSTETSVAHGLDMYIPQPAVRPFLNIGSTLFYPTFI